MSNFTMVTHQIWSCHVTLAAKLQKIYFSLILYYILGKVTKLGGNWLKNKKVTGKKQNLGWNPPSAYRVKVN